MTAPVGPLASEAAQLLDVLAVRLQHLRDRQRRPVAGSDESAGAGSENAGAGSENAGGGDENLASGDENPGSGDENLSADHESLGDAHPGRCPQCGHDPAAASCTGCPWCGALALLRGERPESAARLVDGALTIVQALRGLLAGAAEGDNAPSPAGTGGSGGRGEAGRPGDGADSGLIRIEVR